MVLSRFCAATIVRQAVLTVALGMAATLPVSARAEHIIVPSSKLPAPLGGAMVTGQIKGLVGSALQIKLRNGRTVAINLHAARAHAMVPMLYQGEFVQVQGTMTGQGKMTATVVERAKSAPAVWHADIP
jgi:hypothetical protein